MKEKNELIEDEIKRLLQSAMGYQNPKLKDYKMVKMKCEQIIEYCDEILKGEK
jgi:hypothetical protein